MADMTFTPASFNQAFRSYATEQGNDPSIAKLKAVEVADQTVSVAGGRAQLTSDSVYISPAAAQLYAESVRRQKTVSRRSEVQTRSAHSATTESGAFEAAEVMTEMSDQLVQRSSRSPGTQNRTRDALYP